MHPDSRGEARTAIRAAGTRESTTRAVVISSARVAQFTRAEVISDRAAAQSIREAAASTRAQDSVTVQAMARYMAAAAAGTQVKLI